jgi:WD40 repeat protein
MSAALDQLAAQLRDESRLLGATRRRRAARQLRADNSPDAIAILALALARREPSVAATARAAIDGLEDERQDAIDAVCGCWASTRSEVLGDVIRARGWVAAAPAQLRVLTALHVDQTPDAVCRRWAGTRLETLAAVIREQGWVASGPADVRVLTAALCDRLGEVLRGPTCVQALIAAIEDSDPELAERSRAALTALTDVEAREELCRIAIDDGDPAAMAAAIGGGYAPADPERRAALLFLTAQWELFEELDFDFGLLRAAYDHAGPSLRTRIAARARSAGRREWVEVVVGGSRRRRMADMSDAEWETTIEVLDREDRRPEAWALAVVAPPLWAVRLLHTLTAAGWRPPGDERGSGFEELVALAKRCGQAPPGGRAFARKLGRVDADRRVAFSSDGALLAGAGSHDGVRVWRMAHGSLHASLRPREPSVRELAFSPDGAMLAVNGANGTLDVFRVADGLCEAALCRDADGSHCEAISPDGSLFVVVGGDELELCEIADPGRRRALERAPMGYHSVVFSPGGDLLAAWRTDRQVLVWRTADDALEATIDCPLASRVRFSPDGELLATQGSQGLSLWRIDDGSKLWRARGAALCEFGPAGGFLAATERTGVRLWRTADAAPATLLDRSEDLPWSASFAFSPDGRTIATQRAGRVSLWDTSDGALRAVLDQGAGEASDGDRRRGCPFAFSPDGAVLATGSGGRLRLWRTADGGLDTTVDVKRAPVRWMAFSPVGDALAFALSEPPASPALWLLSSWVSLMRRVPADLSMQDVDIARREIDRLGDDDTRRPWLELTVELVRRRDRHEIVGVERAPRRLVAGELDIEVEA